MSPQHSEPLSCTSHSDTDKVARMTSLILGLKFSYLGTLPVNRPSLLGWSVKYSSLSFARVVYVDVDVDAHDGTRRDPTAPPLSFFLSSKIFVFSYRLL